VVSKGGKPAWISDEAHGDQIRIIQSELAKTRAAGGSKEDIAALERELKRLGVEPEKGAVPLRRAVRCRNCLMPQSRLAHLADDLCTNCPMVVV
jgi:hypothetical protein